MKERSDNRAPRDSAAPNEPRSALDWAVRAGVADGVLRELERRASARRRRRRGTAAAAGIAVLLGVVAFWRLPSDERIQATEPVVASVSRSAVVSLPERRVLPDGSTIELRDGTEVRVAFTDALRCVELLRGEAHFAVVRNSAWPFVVVAAGVEVRAVGTAFAVQVADSAVEVLVTEGRVAVEQPTDSEAETVRALAMLDAGRRVVIDTTVSLAQPEVPVLEVDAAEAAQRLAWRVPRLEFSGTPLGEVVPMFNQHSSMQLRLADPSLARVQLSGIVRADNPEPLFRLLRDNYGIVAERDAEGVVVLRRRL